MFIYVTPIHNKSYLMTLEAKRRLSPQSVAFVENAQMYTLQNVPTIKNGQS